MEAQVCRHRLSCSGSLLTPCSIVASIAGGIQYSRRFARQDMTRELLWCWSVMTQGQIADHSIARRNEYISVSHSAAATRQFAANRNL